jgi:hypothetical protein
MPSVLDIKDSSQVGHQNNLLSSLFSTTPFTYEEANEVTLTGDYDGRTATVDIVGGWQGTVVPNTGMVEKVYFNTNLSIEEVLNIITNIEYHTIEVSSVGIYGLLHSTKDDILVFKYDELDYVIGSTTDGIIWSSIANENDGRPHDGWYINNVIEINDNVVDKVGNEVTGTNFEILIGAPVGEQNNLLAAIFSITPFTYKENNTIDMKPYINEKKLPLKINVNGPKVVSGGSSVSGTPIPSSGYIENIYVNVNTEPEELANKLDELLAGVGVDPAEGFEFPLFVNEDETVFGALFAGEGIYAFVIFLGEAPIYAYVYTRDSTKEAEIMAEAGFIGWNPTLTDGVVPVNAAIIDISILLGDSFSMWEMAINEITPFISSTPFVSSGGGESVELIGEYDGSNVTIKIPDTAEGTEVPNSGYIEKVYLNTSLSVNEVKAIMDKLTYNIYGVFETVIYNVYTNTNDKVSINFAKSGGVYIIMPYSGDMYFYYSPEGGDFIGWNPTFDGTVYVNSEVKDTYTSDNETFSSGTQNNKLTKIFSTTPFEEVIPEYIDVKSYIDKNKIPLKINLNVRPTPKVNTLLKLIKNTKSCAYLFQNYIEPDLDSFLAFDDVSEATDFSYMFKNCTNAKIMPELNTSKGINFEGMYYNCTAATSFPLIDTSNGRYFNYMYYDCSSVTEFPLINTQRGINFNYMYYGCHGATSFPEIDTSRSNYFSYMYYGCYGTTTFPLIYARNVVDFSHMYHSCHKAITFPKLDTISGEDFSYMYSECRDATSFPELNTQRGINFSYMYDFCDTTTSFPKLNTSNGTDFNHMYNHCSNATSFPALDTSKGTNFSCMYNHCKSATSLPQLDTSNGTNFSGMYQSCESATSFPLINTSNGTDFSGMYNNCHTTSFPLIDTSKGTNFNYMYSYCVGAESFPELDTSNGESFEGMYQYTQLPKHAFLNTSKGTSFKEMYKGCEYTKEFPLIDTHNGIDFSDMYYKCSSAQSFPLIDTSNGTDFSRMYYNCSCLETELPLIDTSNGTNFMSMYALCQYAKLPLINTSKGTNFNFMYEACTHIATFPLIDTSNGTSFTGMYEYCANATAFPELNTSNGTNFREMYKDCRSTINFPEIDTSKGVSFSEMYYGCNSAINIPAIDTSSARDLRAMFGHCCDIKKTDISSYQTIDPYQIWYNCCSLKAVIIRSFSSSYSHNINGSTFEYCYHMLGTVDETYNPEGLKDGYVYVPRDMITKLQAKDYWNQLQFRALEDYTKDGTTTGEFDDEKAGLV